MTEMLKCCACESQQEKIDPRLKIIAEHYGFNAQANKAVEELAELIVAIKNLEKKDGKEAYHLVNFVEELADVKIMVDQLIYLNNKGAPENYSMKFEIEFKIERQLKRIEEEHEIEIERKLKRIAEEKKERA